VNSSNPAGITHPKHWRARRRSGRQLRRPAPASWWWVHRVAHADYSVDSGGR